MITLITKRGLVIKMQVNIGKNGLNEGIIEVLENAFKTRERVRISVLKAAGHTRENVKQIAENIISKLGTKYDYTIIGFVIIIRKYRKPRR